MSPDGLRIKGGGLWGGLLAYRLHQLFPEIPFTLYERGASFGGNHTWSFNEGDVPTQAIEWLEPFITHRWDGYSVIFPEYQRDFKTRYFSISSERFHEVLLRSLPESKFALNKDCPSGECLDATGKYHLDQHRAGFQKFVGLQVRLEKEHNILLPILMDSSVKQLDGYRFIYYLPLSKNEILIEDTRYSENNILDTESIIRDLEEVIFKKGWVVKSLIRKEHGVLPLPFSPIENHSNPAPSMAGIFHDVTGYSLPDAVRLIDLLVQQNDKSLTNFHRIIAGYRQQRSLDRKYFQILNRLMFKASEPHQRYKVLQHFYKLPQPLIERFYQGELRGQDRLRIFMGKPPVPVLKAIKTFLYPSSRWS